MLLIAELAHQRDPQTIAEIIFQELQPLDIERLNIDVDIVDSSLELKILTDSAIDKQKLLTLVRSKFQDLRIESIAKFRIHCWRNDEEMHEQRLLWTEQFMLDLPISSPRSLPKALPDLEPKLDDTRSPETGEPETRAPESQLSKHSVLQQAIKKISPTSYDERINSLAPDLDKQPTIDGAAIASDPIDIANTQKSQSSIDSNYWQLLLVGLSIVLLGLGIGASVRAITAKNTAKDTAKDIVEPSPPISSASSSVDNRIKSSTNSTKNIPSQISEPAAVTSQISPKANPSSAETITTNLQEEEQVITLEKFNRIQKGMSIEQVEKVFGVSGKVIAENNTSNSIGRVYSWKNLQGSNAIVEFKDGQVVAKAQAGL
jgi:ribosomal protein L23